MAWRNSYLQGTVELRTGAIQPSIKLASEDVIANTPTGMFLDFIAVTLNAEKAEAAGLDFNFGVYHPDVGERYYGEVSNANMSNIEVDKIPSVDFELIIHKSDFTKVVLGETTDRVPRRQSGFRADYREMPNRN